LRRTAQVALVLIASGGLPLAAQEFRATLNGRVSDPSRAPIASAAVTVKNEGTSGVYQAKTDSNGNCVVPFLPPATYAKSVSAEGFRLMTRSGQPLAVAQSATLNFALEAGDVRQEITVSAEAPLLEHSAERGGLVGLYQVNLRIPATATSGDPVELYLEQNQVPSNKVTIAIK
jgi:uncharacterized protein (TIGR03437 family)